MALALPLHNSAFSLCLKIYACSQSIFVYNCGDDIHVWDIPNLVSVTQSDLAGIHFIDNPRTHFFRPLLVDGDTDLLFSGTSIWQRRSISVLHLLSLVAHETPTAENFNLTLYSLRDVERLNDSFLPRLLPVLCGCSQRVHGDNHPALLRGAVSSLFNCDNHLVFCTASQTINGMRRGGRQIVAVVLPIPSCFSKDRIDVHSLTLTPANGIEEDTNRGQIGFCPMSGRLVYVLPDGVELRLADYLSPPKKPSRQELS